MITKDEYLKRNRFAILVKICAALCVVSLIYGLYHSNSQSTDWASLGVGFGLLALGCVIQVLGERAYSRYVDAVNKNPNDDLK